MLYAVGLTDADMTKAQVGISSVWYEGNPCNMHLNRPAARRKPWTPPALKASRGILYKYIRTVTSASEGCVTDA